MQNIILQIHKRLLKTAKTVAVAESCTGGLLSSMLTQTPGSSRYFILGAVTYSNQAKKDILKIPASVIRIKGAVSKETALLMAGSVRRLAKTDLGIAVTGIAGPTGGSTRKPVGTVYIAVAAKDRQICKKFIFQGSRAAVRNKSAQKALELLKHSI